MTGQVKEITDGIRNGPLWLKLLLGLILLILSVSLSINGALLVRDREELSRQLQQINSKLDQIISRNNEQEKQIARLNLLISLPYEERKKVIQNMDKRGEN